MSDGGADTGPASWPESGPEPGGGALDDTTAGVVAPPPLIFAGAITLGLVAEWVWPTMLHAGAPSFGVLLLAAGLVIAVMTVPRFRRAKTPVDPFHATRALIITGPFRFSRNPLYLSLALVHLGLGLMIGSLLVLIIALPAIAVMQWGVISREERYLEARFGDDYRAYKGRVRRWL